MKKIVATFIMVGLVLPGIAFGSLYSDFQKDIQEPYGWYKKSLGVTSKKENKQKALKAVEEFVETWKKFSAQYENDVPDQLQQIQDFKTRITRPVAIGESALKLLQQGEVLKAHAILEEVRYSLWDMRVQANIISLNDKVNDFHEAMEIVLDKVKEAETADALQHIEQRYGAWLAIKWKEVGHASGPGTDTKEFHEGVAAGFTAIEELRKSMTGGDNKAAAKAGGKVKKAYKSIFFLPFCS